MKTKILLYWMLLLLACNISYGQDTHIKPHKLVRKECIALDDSAMTEWMSYFKTLDSLKIDTALALINKAIDCDTAFVIAYENKITIQNHLKDYKGAMATLNKLPVEYKNNSVNLVKKGILLKKLNRSDSSSYFYRLALDKSIEEEKLEPHNVAIQINHLLCVALVKGKKQALEEYKDLRKKYKDNEQVENLESVLETFDINSFDL